jgi:hypothetical protein
MEGGTEEGVSGIRTALADPAGTAAALGGREWVRARHAPAPWVPRLLEVYRAAGDHSGGSRLPR